MRPTNGFRQTVTPGVGNDHSQRLLQIHILTMVDVYRFDLRVGVKHGADAFVTIPQLVVLLLAPLLFLRGQGLA
jgi:hypothetical protein